MKFVIALVSYLESLGYDTSSLRKSADGSKAIVHMQYAEILAKNLDTNANVTIYDRVNPDFQALLASDEWNGNVTGTPNSFGDLAELAKYEARLTAQVTEAKTDMDNFQIEIAGEVTTAKEDLNAIVDNYQVTVSQQLEQQLEQTSTQASQNKPSTYRRVARKPLVTFIDDDGKLEVFTRLYPIFKEKGVPLCPALITSRLGTTGYMTRDNVKTLVSEGWEMLGHTHNAHSPNMSVVTEDYLINDVQECRQQLSLLGSSSRAFVYPEANSNPSIRRITQSHFDYAFGDTGINQTANIDIMKIKRVGFGNWGAGADLNSYKANVDNIIANGGWLVFMLHVGTGKTPEQELAILPGLIDYIIAQGVDIVTATEGYEAYGSKLYIGDKSDKYLNFTGDGVFGNIPLNLDGTSTITQLAENAKPSSAGIGTYSQGQTVVGISGAFSLSDGGFPNNSLGIFITHRYNLSYHPYNYQEFHVYNKNEVYIRYALTATTWSNWSRAYPVEESKSPIITDVKNSKTNANLPTDFADGKITYTELDSAHMANAGFPTTTGCTLVNDSIIRGYNYGQVRQTLREFSSNNTWIRSASSSTAWRAWAKVTVV